MPANTTEYKKAYLNLERLIQGLKDAQPESMKSFDMKEAHSLKYMDYVDLEGKTLLYYAIMMGDESLVRSCIESGASIKENYLPYALHQGHIDVARYLGTKYSYYQRGDFSDCINTESLDLLLKLKLKKGPLSEEDKGILIRAQFNIAVRTGDIDKLNSLLEENVATYPGRLYSVGALHLAIQNNQKEAFDVLLKNNASMDYQTIIKQTPLMWAVQQTNPYYLQKLLEDGADISLKDINGNTVLHYAVTHGQEDKLKMLLAHKDIQRIQDHKNIYGQTAHLLALQDKKDTIIQALGPQLSLEQIHSDPSYGNIPTSTRQADVINKIRYYFQLGYRDQSYIESIGHCNGLSYLFLLRNSQGKEDSFYDTLALLSGWDGSKDTLMAPLDPSLPQAHEYAILGYHSLSDIFEQWSNDLIWFQQSGINDISKLKQDERKEQHELIDNSSDNNPIYLRKKGLESEWFKHKTDYTHLPMLKELLQYLHRMPAGIQIEWVGNAHVTASAIKEGGVIEYYDPNFEYPTSGTKNSDEIYQQHLDYKYILLGPGKSIDFSIFYFNKDLLQLHLDDFKVLSEEEMPKSREEAKAFALQSPNGFSPLHVAVITHSLATLKQLIKDGYCDPLARASDKTTALEMACKIQNGEAVTCLAEQLILEHPEKLQELERLALDTYHGQDISLFKVILKHQPTAEFIQSLFKKAINFNDMELMKTLVELHKVDINKLNTDGVDIQYVRAPIMEYLLNQGLNVLNGLFIFKMKEIKPAIFSSSIEQLESIDGLDQRGKGAIHYAAESMNVVALSELLAHKASLFQKTTGEYGIHSSALEMIFFDPGFISYTDPIPQKKCIDLAVSAIHFHDLSASDKTELTAVLNKLFNEVLSRKSDLETFEKILSRCPKEYIHSIRTDSGHSLLQEAILFNQLSMAKVLLEKGENPNEKFQGDPLIDYLIKEPGPKKYEAIRLLFEYAKNDPASLASAISLVKRSDDKVLKSIFHELPPPEESSRCSIM